MNGLVRVCVLAFLVWLPLGCSEHITGEQYIEKAQDNLDKGEYRTAEIELKNALRQDGNNPQARRMLGTIHLILGDAESAEKELRRARELGVADESVLPDLVRALHRQGKYEEVETLPVHNLVGKEAKADVLSIRGLAKLRVGESKQAEQEIEQALTLAPSSPHARTAKAILLANSSRYEEAQQELEKALTLKSDHAPAWTVLGDIQQRKGQFVEAEQSYSKAIQNRFANDADLLKRAKVRIQSGKYETAQEDLQLLLQRTPNHPAVNEVQGLVHLRNNDLQMAKESFETALAVDSRRSFPKYHLGVINLRLGNLEQAESYAEQAFVAAPGSVPVRELLAEIKLRKRDYDQVEELTGPVLAVFEDDVSALSLEASALIGQDKPEQAVPLLEKVLALQPDDAVTEMRLGLVFLEIGRTEEGLARLSSALEKNPDLQLARIRLIRFHIREKNLDEAMQIAEDYLGNQPEDVVPWNLIGGLAFDLGDVAEAKKAFQRALEIAPGNPVASQSLAMISIKEKQYEKARNYYQEVLIHNEDHLDTLLKLVVLDQLEKNEALMLEHLKRASAAHPGVVRPQVLLARYHLLRGEADKVFPLMEGLERSERDSVPVLQVVAMAQLDEKQFRNAKLSLKKLIQLRPGSSQSHFLLAQALGGLGDWPGMRKQLQKVVELEPGHFMGRVALARQSFIEGNAELAQKQVEELESIFPDHPELLRLKAALAKEWGDRKAALGLLENVFEEVPNTRNMLSLAREYRAMGKMDTAVSLQEKWVKQYPEDIAALLALAAAYGVKADTGRAVELYKSVLEKDENNVPALNDLALLLRGSEPEIALEYATRASDLAPGSPLVMDTLAMVQFSNGQTERASRSIERALQKDPRNVSIRYHSALIAEASGDTWEATRVLSELLEDPVKFPERKEAEQMLQRLLSN